MSAFRPAASASSTKAGAAALTDFARIVLTEAEVVQIAQQGVTEQEVSGGALSLRIGAELAGIENLCNAVCVEVLGVEAVCPARPGQCQQGACTGIVPGVLVVALGVELRQQTPGEQRHIGDGRRLAVAQGVGLLLQGSPIPPAWQTPMQSATAGTRPMRGRKSVQGEGGASARRGLGRSVMAIFWNRLNAHLLRPRASLEAGVCLVDRRSCTHPSGNVEPRKSS